MKKVYDRFFEPKCGSYHAANFALQGKFSYSEKAYYGGQGLQIVNRIASTKYLYRHFYIPIERASIPIARTIEGVKPAQETLRNILTDANA